MPRPAAGASGPAAGCRWKEPGSLLRCLYALARPRSLLCSRLRPLFTGEVLQPLDRLFPPFFGPSFPAFFRSVSLSYWDARSWTRPCRGGLSSTCIQTCCSCCPPSCARTAAARRPDSPGSARLPGPAAARGLLVWASGDAVARSGKLQVSTGRSVAAACPGPRDGYGVPWAHRWLWHAVGPWMATECCGPTDGYGVPWAHRPWAHRWLQRAMGPWMATECPGPTDGYGVLRAHGRCPEPALPEAMFSLWSQAGTRWHWACQGPAGSERWEHAELLCRLRARPRGKVCLSAVSLLPAGVREGIAALCWACSFPGKAVPASLC